MTCTDGIDGDGRHNWICDKCRGKGCPDPRDAEIVHLREGLEHIYRTLLPHLDESDKTYLKSLILGDLWK